MMSPRVPSSPNLSASGSASPPTPGTLQRSQSTMTSDMKRKATKKNLVTSVQGIFYLVFL